VESPRITLGWTDGNRARRHVQNQLLERFIASLFPDPRRHPRFFAPPIVAYLGSVGASKLFPIINVSVGGFCLRADELWTPGLVMPIALQRWRTIPQDDPESLTVQAMLVRREGNEAGFAIVLPPPRSLLHPRMRTQQQNILLQEMSDFLKDLPDPLAKPPASTHPYAPTSARLPLKVRQIEPLPEIARPHKLSA
jgi:hypothetical protein